MLYCHVDLIIYYLYRGRAVTKFTSLKPDTFAIYFVKFICFNVNIYMGQYNMQKERASLTLCQELFQYLSHPKTRPDISVVYTLCILR